MLFSAFSFVLFGGHLVALPQRWQLFSISLEMKQTVVESQSHCIWSEWHFTIVKNNSNCVLFAPLTNGPQINWIGLALLICRYKLIKQFKLCHPILKPWFVTPISCSLKVLHDCSLARESGVADARAVDAVAVITALVLASGSVTTFKQCYWKSSFTFGL